MQYIYLSKNIVGNVFNPSLPRLAINQDMHHSHDRVKAANPTIHGSKHIQQSFFNVKQMAATHTSF